MVDTLPPRHHRPQDVAHCGLWNDNNDTAYSCISGISDPGSYSAKPLCIITRACGPDRTYHNVSQSLMLLNPFCQRARIRMYIYTRARWCHTIAIHLSRYTSHDKWSPPDKTYVMRLACQVYASRGCKSRLMIHGLPIIDTQNLGLIGKPTFSRVFLKRIRF